MILQGGRYTDGDEVTSWFLEAVASSAKNPLVWACLASCSLLFAILGIAANVGTSVDPFFTPATVAGWVAMATCLLLAGLTYLSQRAKN